MELCELRGALNERNEFLSSSHLTDCDVHNCEMTLKCSRTHIFSLNARLNKRGKSNIDSNGTKKYKKYTVIKILTKSNI